MTDASYHVVCPVCGFPELKTDIEGHPPPFDYCPCCDFQFDVTDDDAGFTYEQWRERWIALGMPWSAIGIPQPERWDPQTQLDDLLRSNRQAATTNPSRFRCPSCGYAHLEEAPRGPSGGGSYEICPSCGFEYGVTDDDQGYSYATWRERWIAHGMPWNAANVEPIPSDWDPQKQLADLLRSNGES